MPLTEFQETLVRLLAANRTPDSYLAGGAALHLEPNSKRYSNDLDFFQDSEARVASAFAQDRASLEAARYDVEVVMTQPGHIRALVSQDDRATKIEWAHDSAWRFLPVVESKTAGYVLHPIDLALNKVLALAGRDEARDFIDVMHVHGTTLRLGALCWAAAGKDPGFTPAGLLALLRRRGKYHPEDFARLRLQQQPDLPLLKTSWLAALEHAEQFIGGRPPDEVGCLYYSCSRQKFVSDFTDGDPDVRPHYGRPGGVWPQVCDA